MNSCVNPEHGSACWIYFAVKFRSGLENKRNLNINQDLRPTSDFAPLFGLIKRLPLLTFVFTSPPPVDFSLFNKNPSVSECRAERILFQGKSGNREHIREAKEHVKAIETAYELFSFIFHDFIVVQNVKVSFIYPSRVVIRCERWNSRVGCERKLWGVCIPLGCKAVQGLAINFIQLG